MTDVIQDQSDGQDKARGDEVPEESGFECHLQVYVVYTQATFNEPQGGSLPTQQARVIPAPARAHSLDVICQDRSG